VEAFRPIIAEVVRAVLEQVDGDRAKLNGRLAFPEAEAAALLGLRPHVLRDCRRRGEIPASKVGSKIVYLPADLIHMLDKQRREV